MTSTIRLKKGKEESLLRRHPWVFSGAIASLPDGIEEGDLVNVTASDGTLLGCGHYQIGSIAVRILEFGASSLPADFFLRRLDNAFSLRRALGLIRPDNDCYRLVHGEGDFLPGLVVDIYGDTAVMQAHSPGMHFCRNEIAQALTLLPDARIRNVYYKSETTLPYKAHLDPENEYLIGSFDGNIAIENGLKFNIDWMKGQKTGFFLDQRENRELVRRYAAGRTVLNTFCYTGGFSVYALAGGAREVCSVDSSERAVELAAENVRLNFGDDAPHTAVAADAVEYLKHIDDRYDLIILDPPAFAKHHKVLGNAMQGYKRLNARALSQIKSGGILFTFSCSQAVSKELFRTTVFSAAAIAGRKVRILHQLTQPADHPIDIYHPEGEYLKGLVLYVE